MTEQTETPPCGELTDADAHGCRWIDGRANAATSWNVLLRNAGRAGRLMVCHASQDRLGLPANLAPPEAA
jgi:hypothetical protein